jgi:hypothetical protein
MGTGILGATKKLMVRPTVIIVVTAKVIPAMFFTMFSFSFLISGFVN